MATFPVTEINDNVDGSLRDAIARANTRPGPDVIVFDSSLSSQTISLTGRLNITGDLTMNGLGADRLTIDGNGNDIFGIQRSVANGDGCRATFVNEQSFCSFPAIARLH